MFRASLLRARTRNVPFTSVRSFHLQSSLLCSCKNDTKLLNSTTSDPTIPPADHRALASALDLFSTTAYSPGTPLLHPDGSHVFLRLQQFLRAQYAMFGFREVVSPTIYKQSLWEKSGHWENYKRDMFEVTGSAHGDEADSEQIGQDHTYGLKPMNCPGHCLLYASRSRSWRDLPIRYADFSPLHRNEVSGALSGLTRVRRFHQDDGHMFCRPEQVGEEIQKTLQFVGMVYDCFGLGPYKLVLSTRPEEYMGEVSQWDEAESQLRHALDATGRGWELNEADGAFYGPKIDIILKDSDGKQHQTATIQLDFQLPQRFELEYDGQDGSAQRPVMIHRAILGSLERFMALLIEHFKGRWPFWLSPRQVAILTVNDAPETIAYAEKVQDELLGFTRGDALQLQPLNSDRLQTSIDTRPMTVSAKVAQARADHYNLIAVVGPRDMKTGTLSLDVTGQPRSESLLNGLSTKFDTPNGKVDPKSIKLSPNELKQLTVTLCQKFL